MLLRHATNRTIPFLATCLCGLMFSCTTYKPFDAVGYLRQEYQKLLPGPQASAAEVPFALDDEIVKTLDGQYKPGPNELRRIEQVQDLIHRRLRLRYSLTPTRNAIETYRTREGNCLSFVNLFVGVARHQRLAPFYVEVTDYQRWNYRAGLVVSRGHIVAGLYVKGKLQVFDHLPYRTKAYKDFKPIDDVTAAAHYYNNLGAEALLDGKADEALSHLELACQIDPLFVKSINNLGVALARSGKLDEALTTYQRGLAIDPQDVALLTNLARIYQDLNRLDEAAATLAKVENSNNSNPFFFVYQGEIALARSDFDGALRYLAQALKLDSELPEVHVTLAQIYLAMGDFEKARHHLGRSLKLDATNPEARKLLMILGTLEEDAAPDTQER